jgi:hypothetical protein
MKTFLIIIILLLICSCDKINRCYDCTRTKTEGTIVEIKSFKQCDMTLSEIVEYEQAGSFNYYIKPGLNGSVVVKCKR